MSTEIKTVVTQLVVDASGAKTGVAEFEAALEKARKAANDGEGGVRSFDATLKQWTKSLAATDPVLRAQVAMQQAVQRQQDLNTRAVQLGIATQDAANTQLEKVRQRHQALLDDVKRSTSAETDWGRATTLVTGQVTRLVGVLSVASVAAWGRQVFNDTAALVDQAKQLQQTTDALQAYRAEFQQDGSSRDEADKALAKTNKEVGDAVDNIGDARRQLAEWNVDWKQLAAAAPDQRLALIAKGLLGIEDGARRARAEQDLFSKSGSEVETVLEDLAVGVDKLIQKQKERGVIVPEDEAVRAKKAADAIVEAMQKLETNAAPAVVTLTEALSGLLNQLNDVGPKVPQLLAALTSGNFGMARLALTPMPANVSVPKSDTVYSAIGGGAEGVIDFHGAASNLSAQMDTLRNEAALAGQTAGRRAQITAEIAAANAKLKDGQVYQGAITDWTGKQAANEADALRILSPIEAAEARRLGTLTAQGDQLHKTRLTFDGYLSSLAQEVALAGKSSAEREAEADIIKGAQVVQKQRGVEERNLVQTYDAALTKLTESQVLEIRRRDDAKLTAQFENQIGDEITLANAAIAAGVDGREQAVKAAQAELALGRDLKDAEKERLKTLQQKTDILRAQEALDPNAQDRRVLQTLNGMELSGQTNVIDLAAARANSSLRNQATGVLTGLGSSNPFGAAGAVGQQGAIDDVQDNAARARKTLKDAADAGLISERNAAKARIALEQDTTKKLLAIETSYQDAKLSLGQDTFDALATGLGDMFGKQSAAYKAAFAVEKAFQIARSTLALETAIAQAAAVPWPANIPAIAEAVTLGSQILSELSQVSAAGFKDGIIGLGGPGTGTSDSIPAWLSNGESVITATATARNPRTLTAINAGANFDAMPRIKMPDINISQAPGVAVQVVGLSEDEVELTATRVADERIAKKAPGVVAASQRNPNGQVAKATLSRFRGGIRRL